MATVRNLYKSGNSTVMAVPAYMLEALDLSWGDSVTVECVANKELRIRKLSAAKPHSSGKLQKWPSRARGRAK